MEIYNPPVLYTDMFLFGLPELKECCRPGNYYFIQTFVASFAHVRDSCPICE